MSRRRLVDAYMTGQISRRVFIRKLVKTGVALGSAVTFASVLGTAAASSRGPKKKGDFYDFYSVAPPGHGGVPHGHGGTPPGQSPGDEPPGHRGTWPGNGGPPAGGIPKPGKRSQGTGGPGRAMKAAINNVSERLPKLPGK